LCNDKESSVEQLLAEGTCLTSRVSQNFPQSTRKIFLITAAIVRAAVAKEVLLGVAGDKTRPLFGRV
jgi:hypothetical protein